MFESVRIQVAVWVAVVLTAAACGGGPTPAPPATGPEPTTLPAALPATSPAPATTSTPEPTRLAPTPPATTSPVASQQPQTPGAAIPGNDLSSLSSYRLDTVIKVSIPAQAGKVQTATVNMQIDQVKAPPASHVTLSGLHALAVHPSNNQLGDTLEYYVIGNTAYIKLNNQWIAGTTQDAAAMSQTTQMFQAATFLKGINAKQVGSAETVNGVPATHYAFNDKDVAQKPDATSPIAGLHTFQGEYWLATPGNYIVKYQMQGQGNIDFSDTLHGPGSMDIAVNMTQVNQPLTIQPPIALGGLPGLGEIPIPDGARLNTTMGNLATLEAENSTVPAMAAFYDKALADKGFKKQAGAVTNDTFSTARYVKDGDSVVVSVTVNEGKVTVLLNSEKQ